VSLYPVMPGAGDGFTVNGLMVAVRLEDVASPLRNGVPLAPGSGPALVVGGTERIRSGEVTVFCKVVAVAPAVVRRDGRVQAQGSPAAHATLGPLEEWLESQAGPGVVEEVAERAVLDRRFVKGERERLLTRAFMIRAIVLMTLVPDAGVREAGLPALAPLMKSKSPGTAPCLRRLTRLQGGVKAGVVTAVVLDTGALEVFADPRPMRGQRSWCATFSLSPPGLAPRSASRQRCSPRHAAACSD
jgi:hypothetical protein